MKLYLLIIFCCVILITAIVTFVSGAGYLYVLGFTALAVVIVIAIDALVSTIARLLPKKCAQHEAKVFTVSAKEKKFYEKLKIRKWKDKVPEIGQFTGFRKNKIVDPKSVEYLDRFLLEICYGEIGHFFSVFLGFALLLFYPLTDIWFAVSIPVAIINIFMNLPSLFILRYNSYKLVVLRKSNLKKQARFAA
ncbi:MAG: hypothetical protein J6A38_03690 [Clostridia bacterium]|nr:hypothetical protein [Clostridia bacterium]